MTDLSIAGGGPTRAEPLGVVVVSVDQGRLAQYRAALRMAGVTAALTSDADEAETWLRERQPTSMVLDQGLPRMTVFRLYGLVRAEESMRGIAVLFVGQEGEGGSQDHYLPADASPLAVAAQAQQLAAEHAQAAGPAEPEATPAWQPAHSEPAAAPTSLESWTLSGPPVSDAEHLPVRRPEPGVLPTDEPAAEAEIPAKAPARSGGRRLDVILFRAGIVLLILGLVAVWLNPVSTTPVQVPPTASPAPSGRPPASPSPAALGPESELHLSVAAVR